MSDGTLTEPRHAFSSVQVVILLKAMGVTSDQEVVQLVGSEPNYVQAITASLQASAAFKHTRARAWGSVTHRMQPYPSVCRATEPREFAGHRRFFWNFVFAGAGVAVWAGLSRGRRDGLRTVQSVAH
eukprot:scaffold16329_cov121-Isochrysis_galbana.AAC.15